MTNEPKSIQGEQQSKVERKAAARAAELDAHIKRLVDAAPPLTAAQRDRIAGLLRAPGP
jgi:hypothetical protein